jgi:hypothetical protein
MEKKWWSCSVSPTEYLTGIRQWTRGWYPASKGWTGPLASSMGAETPLSAQFSRVVLDKHSLSLGEAKGDIVFYFDVIKI